MDQPTIETVLQQLGFANLATITAQILNNGSFNIDLIRTLTIRGIVVKITFGQEQPMSCLIELDPSLVLADVSDKEFQVRWPADVERVLNKRGLAALGALQYVSIAELKLLEGMTPRILEMILTELHSRRIFLQELPSPDRQNVLMSTSIEALGLQKRIQQCLLDSRIFTIGMLITWPFDGLVALPGLGRSSVTEISNKLANYGLQLRSPNFLDYSNWMYQRRI